MLLSTSCEILFRGVLASYLVLFAMDIKTYPTRWTNVLNTNIDNYSQYLAIPDFKVSEEVAPEWLNYYCQWLILCSLLIISGLRAGKVVAWFAIILNFVACWTELELLFIGIWVLM